LVVAIEVIFRTEAFGLVSVTVVGREDVPTSILPKLIDGGENDGAAIVPVPLSAIGWGPFGACSAQPAITNISARTIALDKTIL
jgi:hypothetical protein